MSSSILNKTHPQKHCLKTICKVLYLLGLGEYWYEENPRSSLHKCLYQIYVGIVVTYLIMIIINQMCSILKPNLSNEEYIHIMIHVSGHMGNYLKMVFLVIKRNQAKELLRKLVEENREEYSSLELERASTKKAKLYALTVGVVSYFTLVGATIDRTVTYFKEGIPIQTQVVYYPSDEDHGVFFNVLRLLVHLHWWFVVAIMISLDYLVYCCLIFLEYKFKFLQIYFENLRDILLENANGDHRKVLEKELKDSFILGNKMHEQTLWIAKHVQSNLGYIYSTQLLQSLALLVMCLIRLVIQERTLSFLLFNLCFTITMCVLIGSYMIASGDITYQASVLSTSIFHCGWELLKADRSFRAVMVVTLIRAQKPVYMTAFGIFILSYSNFIVVLRLSYSFFTVMY